MHLDGRCSTLEVLPVSLAHTMTSAMTSLCRLEQTVQHVGASLAAPWRKIWGWTSRSPKPMIGRHGSQQTTAADHPPHRLWSDDDGESRKTCLDTKASRKVTAVFGEMGGIRFHGCWRIPLPFSRNFPCLRPGALQRGLRFQCSPGESFGNYVWPKPGTSEIQQ